METLFKLMHWSVACIFVFTSIRLGYLLEIEKITNECRQMFFTDRLTGQD